MKKTLITIVTLTAITCSGTSIGAGNRQGGEQRLQRMQQHLNLSDSQVEEIRSIREQGGGRDEVRAILTDEQIKLVRESHRQRNGEHRGGPPKDQETQE